MKKVLDVIETIVDILSILLPFLKKKTEKPSDEPIKPTE